MTTPHSRHARPRTVDPTVAIATLATGCFIVALGTAAAAFAFV